MPERTDIQIAAALLSIACLILLALLAGWIAPHDPAEVRKDSRLKPPCWDYPLGTDHLGRCILSRLLFGIRTSLAISLTVVLLSAAIGLALGGIAGYLGGLIDEAIMRLADALLAFPSIFLALAVIGFLGAGITNLIISLVLVQWTGYARLVRSIVLSLKGREFLEAALGMGASEMYILSRHILPNLLPLVMVTATLELGFTILNVAALSFLGIGVQPPTPEWGSMMNDARPYIRIAPHMMTFPGIAITMTVLAFNLLGEGLRERLDPRSPSTEHL